MKSKKFVVDYQRPDMKSFERKTLGEYATLKEAKSVRERFVKGMEQFFGEDKAALCRIRVISN